MEVVFPALEVVSKREHLSCGKPCLSPHTRLQQTNKPIISTRIFLLPRPNRSLTHPFFHIPHPSSRNSGRPYRLIRPGHPAPWDQNTPQNRTTNISPRIPSSPLKTHFLPPTITTTLFPLLTFNTAPLALCDRLSFTLHQDLTKAAPSTLRLYPKRHASTPHPLRDTLLQHPGGFVAHHVPRRKEPSLSFLLPPHASHPVPSAQPGSPDT